MAALLRRAPYWRRALILVLCCGAAAKSVAQPSQLPTRGTIAGQVTDKEGGRGVPFPLIEVMGTSIAANGDAEGRFRLPNVPVGVHRARARRLGFQPGILDSVRVYGDSTTVVNFALTQAVTQLAATQVQEAANAASESGMLAQQRASAVVMDGISSEAIARAPGSNAADAVTRVTGVAVVDKKFTVVRGLPERYNNTLLNGVDLPSPEPLRKIVPLDIFPSSLLESIVASKTATPDKPGDFAGGSVEIRTKEFPDRRVAQFNVSQEWNSLSTFQDVPYAPRRGLGWFGFSGDRAAPPRPAPGTQDREINERFAESLRNMWTPALRTVPPGLGLGLTFGDRAKRLGYTVSLSYSTRIDHQPGRLYQFTSDTSNADLKGFVADESQTVVDWGGTANLSVMLGTTSRVGLKTLYTRNGEENVALQHGFDTHRGPERLLTYQVRYVERELLQTQLYGDHLLGFLRNTRFQWTLTGAQASRDEPDNRAITYTEDIASGEFVLQPSRQSFVWFRFLEDRVGTAQFDLTTPIANWKGRDLTFKVGGLYRLKRRSFDADVYTFRPSDQPPSGTGFYRLPPERAFAAEHVGSFNADMIVARLDALGLPYQSDDDLGAYYGMLDLPLPGRIRVVGGARVEHWMLSVNPTSDLASDTPITRNEPDLLPSVNVTVSITDRMNLRLAAYRTLARPDPRELTNDYYQAVTGECGNQGSSVLEHTRIRNADVRWEFYPRDDELLAISGFYKEFDRPLIEVVATPQAGSCVVYYANALSAVSAGGEIEARKSLDFIPLLPYGLSASLNLTIIQAEATLPPPGENFAPIATKFMGQSPFMVNAGLTYATSNERVVMSVLGNAFGDRISRYGVAFIDAATGTTLQVPDVEEEGRVTLDAKLQVKATQRISWSVSARNLTNAEQRFCQQGEGTRILTGFARPGVSIKIGAGMEF